MAKRRPLFSSLFVASTLALFACVPSGQVVSLTNYIPGPLIEGVVRAPSAVVRETRATSAPASATPAPFRLMLLADEAIVPNAELFLTDPADQFYRINNKDAFSTTSDRLGTYRFQSGFPRNVPIVVAAVMNGTHRVVNLVVPGDKTARVDLGVASTIVTEFLRTEAKRDGKSMAEYDATKLAAITAQTETLLGTSAIPLPDLKIAAIPAMVRAYAVAVGNDQGGLGDAWASLLGHRILSMVTIAGTGEAGYSGDGGPATAAKLDRPRGITADRFNRLYITDEGNGRVREIEPKTGLITTTAGNGQAAYSGDRGQADEAALNGPRAAVTDDAGNVYIADLLNARIRRMDYLTRIISTFAGNPVPDGAGGWLAAHAGDGGTALLGKFAAPRSLVFDNVGDMYITDSEPDTIFHTIRKIETQTGRISTPVGLPNSEGAFAGENEQPNQARLNAPSQITFDPQGRLLIADTENHCVRRVDFQGRSVVTIAGIGGQRGNDPDGRKATETRLDSPVGVAVAPDGRIFFSERTAGRIRLIDNNGRLVTLAGGGRQVEDGNARDVALNQPGDLFFEAGGDLLVADTRNHRVRRLVLRHGT